MTLRFLEQAKTELENAANWYNKSQHGLGDDFLAEINAAMREIEADPFKFARIEKPRTKREIRQHAMKRFPYIIVYERIDAEFLVLAIAHEEQQPGYWLGRKND